METDTPGHTESELVAGLTDHVTLTDGTRDTFAVEAPFTGEFLGEVPACIPEDVEAAVTRAERTQEQWAEHSVENRAEVLLDFHDRVLDNEEELLDLIQRECGKARRTAHEELIDVAINARHYAVRAEEYLASERRRGMVPGLVKTVEHHHPVGVVGIISPWNYPLVLSISDALPALLAGNAVILKPARRTPYTALAAVSLLREAGLPTDLIQVVTGSGRTLGTPLIEGSDYIRFTGSTETGRHIAAETGRNLINCSLELGGKNPAIVLPDADIEKAANGLCRGCFTNAGQLCISIERLYVHEDIREAFTRTFVDAIEDLTLGRADDYSADVGSLISAEQLETVESHVTDATEKGATVLTGGEPRPDIGPYFYEPTVLTDITGEMELAAEETFGPVVEIYGVDSAAAAIERANDSDYGLNASVWTENEERGETLARRIECGSVNINEGYAATYESVDAPMGGMKDSGVGRRHGDEGIMSYTESQTVSVQKHLQLTAPPGIPYHLYATAMNKLLRFVKNVPGLR
jgi:succinate-semialdehyde dehydrogenase/glutarate-semialdehyde dehydrogenase